MILYEYEGKKLLSEAGIRVPESQLITSPELDSSGLIIRMTGGVVLKAQVLSGKRAQAGGIVMVENSEEFRVKSEEMFKKIINGEKVEKILVEEKVQFDREVYLSISYDTDSRSPILTISTQGGTGIEERGGEIFKIDPISQTVILAPIESGLANEVRPESDSGVVDTPQNDKLIVDQELLGKLIKLFFEQDCLLLEINPLVKAAQGWVALDAKVKLDEAALGRHSDPEKSKGAIWNFEPRSAPGHNPTQREIEAKKIDETDYRGTAGSAYFDFDGDIAILASGGGASLTAMDALISLGGKPANYTEYSGNPPKEKVTKLTKIVLSKPGINGLWVVGAVANFTDIYETLTGFMEGLKQAETELGMKFKFPIVIRRGGPRYQEAFEMLKKHSDFDIHLYGPETSITQSAKVMVDLSKKYAQGKLLAGKGDS